MTVAALAAGLVELAQAGSAPRLAATDALDLLAVAEGWKPLAALGWGGAWPPALPALLAAHGLVAVTGRPWRGATEFDGLPDWYSEARVEAWQNLAILYVAAAERAKLAERWAAGEVVAGTEEAVTLAYPECCVADCRARTRRLHALTARWVERQAGADDARRRRLAAAGLPPVPRDDAERQELLAATAQRFAPGTPVAMCAACAADAASPALRLSRRYRQLAARAGLAEHLTEAS